MYSWLQVCWVWYPKEAVTPEGRSWPCAHVSPRPGYRSSTTPKAEGTCEVQQASDADGASAIYPKIGVITATSAFTSSRDWETPVLGVGQIPLDFRKSRVSSTFRATSWEKKIVAGLASQL